ncbi:hypothetical protein X551_04107 [Methylibium sp. T29]|nr:hypothetical protein X551_04107 [Methylibium sp. T29]
MRVGEVLDIEGIEADAVLAVFSDHWSEALGLTIGQRGN